MSERTEAEKFDQVAWRFYIKLMILVDGTRATKTMGPEPHWDRGDKWFNLRTPQAGQEIKKEAEVYRSLTTQTTPHRFRIQVILHISPLSSDQILVSTPSGFDLNPIEPAPEHILLEDWMVYLMSHTQTGDSALHHAGHQDFVPATMYKRGITLFRNIFTVLHILPCWKIARHLQKRAGDDSLGHFRLQLRFDHSDLAETPAGVEPRYEDPLPCHFNFEPLPHPQGGIHVRVTYMANPHFEVLNRETLVHDGILLDPVTENLGKSNSASGIVILDSTMPATHTNCSNANDDGDTSSVSSAESFAVVEQDEAHFYADFVSAQDPRIFVLLRKVLSSQVKDGQDILLGLVEHDAQCALDAIQKILDSSSIESLNMAATSDPRTIPHHLRGLLMKLAIRSDKLPSSLLLSGLQVPSSDNHADLGGFSDIFHGTYRGEKVAIKRLRLFHMLEVSRRPKVKHMFYHESLMWRNLSHRHILPLLGIDDKLYPPTLCMVSPWMQNGSVRNAIDRMKTVHRIPTQALFTHVRRWMNEILTGLGYLHEENVIHGDLRGPNILLDDHLGVKLTDFGLSVFADGASNSYASTRAGAVKWLAPELIEPEAFNKTSSRPTFMSDIYSFGCVIVELYTGKAPFAELSDPTVIMRVMTGTRPERPRFHDDGLMSDGLWTLLRRCWSQQPPDRPDANSVLQELCEPNLSPLKM